MRGLVLWAGTRAALRARPVGARAGRCCALLGHAGAAFDEENVRLHVYVETEELHQRRLPDTTFFMDVFAGVANILPRGAKLE